MQTCFILSVARWGPCEPQSRVRSVPQHTLWVLERCEARSLRRLYHSLRRESSPLPIEISDKPNGMNPDYSRKGRSLRLVIKPGKSSNLFNLGGGSGLHDGHRAFTSHPVQGPPDEFSHAGANGLAPLSAGILLLHSRFLGHGAIFTRQGWRGTRRWGQSNNHEPPWQPSPLPRLPSCIHHAILTHTLRPF